MQITRDHLVRLVASLRTPVLVMGLLDGTALSAVMLVSLLFANRVPQLEPWTFERNAVCEGVFMLTMLLPLLVFRRDPKRLFACGMIAWAVFTLSYWMAGMYFVQLFDALQRTPFSSLMDGAVAYGVIAVLAWVSSMAWHARHHPLISTRRHSTRRHVDHFEP
jgi:hypothetical protein